MAQTTTNYGLYKPEATDTYNHLVYDNPNMDTIDAAMKDNANHAIDSASCIKTGTVHSVTRSNTSCPVFRFTATGDWNTGDTMNVDGTPVSVFLPNGTAAINGAYLINTEVIASIVGSRVTLMTNAADANDVYFDATGTTLASNTVAGAIGELNNASNIEYSAGVTVANMLSSSSENLGTGIDIVRCGKMRSLRLVVSPISSVLYQATAGDRPVIDVNAIGRWKDTTNKYYPCLVTITSAGDVSASYIKETGVSGITDGTVIVTLNYITN